MKLKAKILLRIYVLTLLMIIAMSSTYYYLFTKDVRERSQQSITMTFNLIFYDLKTRVENVLSKIDAFAQQSLANKIELIEMFRSEQQLSGHKATIPYVKRNMTYLSKVADEIHEFGGLINATEFRVYDQSRHLLAMYRSDGEHTITGVYLPNVNAEAFVPRTPDEIWYGILQDVADIPWQPLPEDLPLIYHDNLPDTAHATLGTFQQFVTLQYTIPIFNKGVIEGMCVIQIGIRQDDADTYSQVSQSRVNFFAGTKLSVGTLPDYQAITEISTGAYQQIDIHRLASLPSIEFSDVTIGHESYYQGTLVFGDEAGPLGAITAHFPRQLEREQKRNFFIIMSLVTLIFSVLAIVEAYGLSVGIVQPIQVLEQTVKKFKEENFPVTVPVHAEDEIGTLSRAFNAMALQLHENFERIHAQMNEIQILNTELENRVQSRTVELETANKELKDFAYIVSHDLKAPLHGLSRLAQMLMQDYTETLDEQGQHMLDLLIDQVKRMESLIDGVLEYSRVGRIIAEDEPVELNPLLRDVIAMIAPPEHIEIVVQPALPSIIGDKLRIAQVFQNLLSNAVKFVDKPTGKISVTAEDCGDYWMFSVTDNGIGIDKRHYERIFQIFQTLTPRDGGENTGVGLAIVKKVVELYGGTIWVESTPGQGSTFCFTWPKLQL